MTKRALLRNQEVTLLRRGAGAGEPRPGAAQPGRGHAGGVARVHRAPPAAVHREARDGSWIRSRRRPAPLAGHARRPHAGLAVLADDPARRAARPARLPVPDRPGKTGFIAAVWGPDAEPVALETRRRHCRRRHGPRRLLVAGTAGAPAGAAPHRRGDVRRREPEPRVPLRGDPGRVLLPLQPGRAAALVRGEPAGADRPGQRFRRRGGPPDRARRAHRAPRPLLGHPGLGCTAPLEVVRRLHRGRAPGGERLDLDRPRRLGLRWQRAPRRRHRPRVAHRAAGGLRRGHVPASAGGHARRHGRREDRGDAGPVRAAQAAHRRPYRDRDLGVRLRRDDRRRAGRRAVGDALAERVPVPPVESGHT